MKVMKILPLVLGIRNDICSSGVRLKNATSQGYNIADRTAKIYRQGNCKKYLNITKSVSSKIINGTTRKDLPYVAGAIGTLLPFPLMCPILMGIGFIARFALSNADMIYGKMNQAHINIIDSKTNV